MGRLLQRITDEKPRKLTFRRRWIGLQKKAQELSVLCGLDTCLIVFGGVGDSSSGAAPAPFFWPPNPEQVNAILRRYKEQHARAGQTLKKIINDDRSPEETAEYPAVSDHRFFDRLSVQQCQQLLKFLEPKLEKVRSMINDRLRKAGQDHQGVLAMRNPPNFTETPVPTPASTLQVLKAPHISAAVHCSSTEPYFFGGPSDRNTLCSGRPSPQPPKFLRDPMSENINVVYSNAGGVLSSSTSSRCPAMPPYDYCGYPAHPMVAAPIQSLPPLQMNTETWEQYRRLI